MKNKNGFFGEYGGVYIPEILIPVIEKLQKQFDELKTDESFWKEYTDLLTNYSGRPTPLTYAENLTNYFGKGRIYIKREDLNHSGAHKINNVIGQGLLVKKMGKKRVIAETGAGQHGAATAIMAARMGFEACIYMGAEDMERQYPNVFWMKQLGAKVIPVEFGARTLKDAINEAFKDWATNFDTTHYVLGTACGSAPFPEMVSYFQSIISVETRKQIMEAENRLPTKIYACVGGGSNALGAFYHYLDEKDVELIGVEAGGKGPEGDEHSSRIAYKAGKVGVAQGYKTLFLQDSDGQMKDTYSVAAGLDYIGVSPILADLADKGRVRFEAATDKEVIEALKLLMKKEGIIPALESTHAFACVFAEIKETSKDDIIIINLSGRGDKDIFNVAEALHDKDWKEYIKQRNELYETF